MHTAADAVAFAHQHLLASLDFSRIVHSNTCLHTLSNSFGSCQGADRQQPKATCSESSLEWYL